MGKVKEIIDMLIMQSKNWSGIPASLRQPNVSVTLQKTSSAKHKFPINHLSTKFGQEHYIYVWLDITPVAS